MYRSRRFGVLWRLLIPPTGGTSRYTPFSNVRPPPAEIRRFGCGKGAINAIKSTTNFGNYVEVSWEDGKVSRFHSAWLRFNCHCKNCQQQHSGQRMKTITSCNNVQHLTNKDDLLLVKWNQDSDHTGILPIQYLRANCYSVSSLEDRAQAVRPSHFIHEIKSLPEVHYDEASKNELKWVQDISEYGICLMRGVPNSVGKVKKVAEKLGPVIETIYGVVFDVLSSQNPINIAYSSAQLDFHMDLMYYESPPGIQLLHCLRFDNCVAGGESVFLDVFAVAEQFSTEHQEEFEILVRVPATFQKVHYQRDNPVEMRYQRPHIVLNHQKEIVAVNWSPSFEGPLAVKQEDVEPYYKAYFLFAEAIQSSSWVREISLKEGDLVAFNNRRILHGRRGFQLNGGERHLQGCYVNIDEFKNTCQMLRTTQGDRRRVPRVGNQCWF